MKKILIIQQKDTGYQWFFNIVGLDYFQIGLKIVWFFASKRDYKKCGGELLFNAFGECHFKALGYNKKDEKETVEFESYFQEIVEITTASEPSPNVDDLNLTSIDM